MFSIFGSCTHSGQEDVQDESRRVFINVYDMVQPSLITAVGYFALGVGKYYFQMDQMLYIDPILGIYHSGLELGDREYCFGGHDRTDETGVFVMEPRVGPPNVLYKRSIDMGYTHHTEEEIQNIFLAVSKDFVGPSYSLLTRNCNHFSSRLSFLLTGKPSPAWVNRAAHIGTFFPCFITDDMVQPPDFDDDESYSDISPTTSLLRDNGEWASEATTRNIDSNTWITKDSSTSPTLEQDDGQDDPGKRPLVNRSRRSLFRYDNTKAH
ncbi:PPPDE putative peptidase domain-containing protein [Phycomyces nitens]|nr:PPPDE putative peptidase domain-containing protein [Phycomyces nitens]